MSKTCIDVAIAILLHRGQVLVGWREAKQHQGNKHEFPGGKVELGESPRDACRREVQEEVGITIDDWHVFDLIEHEYDDLVVRLHVFHAVVAQQQCSDIQQPWQWYTREALLQLNFPKANHSIVERLSWAKKIKISDDVKNIALCLTDQLLYLRQNDLDSEILQHIQHQDLAKCILNIDLWEQLPTEQHTTIAAVHLKQHQLMRLESKDRKSGVAYLAACHDLSSLQHAQNIGCDAVLLSPVCATSSHPEISPLGWEQFAAWVSQIDIPVFALGGMQSEQLALAQQHGAYGIAGIRFI